MKFVNCTPHAIVLNSGITIEPSGSVARVAASFSPFDKNGVSEQVFGEVTDLPSPVDRVLDGLAITNPDPYPSVGYEETLYIVSGLVLTAAKAAGRQDVVAPATGHPECVRNEKGHIVSVPGFVR